MLDVTRIGKVFGDRVLVKRFNEPEKKRGIYVPASYAAGKKEPRKMWWAQIFRFGEDSLAESDHDLKVGDIVGIEPLGNHYASFLGEDGNLYCWVPDEHLALLDLGSVVDYYADTLRRSETPRLKVLGNRVLLKPVEDETKVRGVIRATSLEREAKRGEVLLAGTSPLVSVGDTVLHVSADSGSSSEVDIFEPTMTVLRCEDLISVFNKELSHA